MSVVLPSGRDMDNAYLKGLADKHQLGSFNYALESSGRIADGNRFERHLYEGQVC